jgi:hypothetical protein
MTIDFVEPRVEQDQEPPRPVDAHNLVLSYNREELHWKSRSGLDPLVLYGRREERGSFIRYTGLDCPGKARPATLQYYGGIIQATTLVVNQIEHRIEGLGEVTLVNRHGLQHGAHAEVTLAADGSASALILK